MHTPFGGEAPALRAFYYTMLISHIILAISIAYLVPRTFLFAIKGDYVAHKRWAKFTFPIWYYVSVTGVLVYFFLYIWWPAAPVWFGGSQLDGAPRDLSVPSRHFGPPPRCDNVISPRGD